MERTILNTIRALDTSDGAGVRLKRALGYNPMVRLDPFLMLDAFSSENPDDYIAGFPPHPHRGFETVTYLMEGHMKHRDHLGNEGDLQQGGVQWMTAGRGIIHEEMPQQQDGLLRGFQLWINLPAAEKMKAAGYRDIADNEIPRLDLSSGGQIKAIAGEVTIGNQVISAPVKGGSTDPLYLDVKLRAGRVSGSAMEGASNGLTPTQPDRAEKIVTRIACFSGNIARDIGHQSVKRGLNL